MEKVPVKGWMRTHPLGIFILLLLLVDVVLFAIFLSHRSHGLMVAFLDVGQGDAVFIEAPNGNQLLYDAGPPTGAVLSALSEVMPFYDRSIDVAVLSHPDSDHIGGFADVFSRYHVDALLESGASSTNGVFDVVEQDVKEKHIARFIARRGMSIDMGDGVVADILYPDSDTSNMETNSASIVMRLKYGSTSFMLSGDLPQLEEEHLVQLDGNALHANILKLGHHGSRTSSAPSWLRSISPQVAIISAGIHNRYGHPHKEVLELLNRLSIPYLATLEGGTIRFESDGVSVVRK